MRPQVTRRCPQSAIARVTQARAGSVIVAPVVLPMTVREVPHTGGLAAPATAAPAVPHIVVPVVPHTAVQAALLIVVRVVRCMMGQAARLTVALVAHAIMGRAALATAVPAALGRVAPQFAACERARRFAGRSNNCLRSLPMCQPGRNGRRYLTMQGWYEGPHLGHPSP